MSNLFSVGWVIGFGSGIILGRLLLLGCRCLITPESKSASEAAWKVFALMNLTAVAAKYAPVGVNFLVPLPQTSSPIAISQQLDSLLSLFAPVLVVLSPIVALVVWKYWTTITDTNDVVR